MKKKEVDKTLQGQVVKVIDKPTWQVAKSVLLYMMATMFLDVLIDTFSQNSPYTPYAKTIYLTGRYEAVGSSRAYFQQITKLLYGQQFCVVIIHDDTTFPKYFYLDVEVLLNNNLTVRRYRQVCFRQACSHVMLQCFFRNVPGVVVFILVGTKFAEWIS